MSASQPSNLLSAAAATPATTKPRILIVDDVPANVHTLHHILVDGYDVRFALSGEQALEAMERSPVDLVLLDVNMPGTNGYEVCRQMQGDPALRGVPVIFITGQDSEQDEERGFRVGAVDYVTKPFSAAVVRARVKTHVTLKRQRDRLEALSTVDGLTEIPNQRAFMQRLHAEWYRARDHARPLSLMLLDLDHFALLNDTVGRLEGDECLRQVAQALVQWQAGASDFIARLGEDEFGALVPEASGATAVVIAEQMRTVVQLLGLHFDTEDGTQQLSASVGLTCFDATKFGDAEAMLLAARSNLAQAKARGRNCTVADSP